jgi:hypothetical protein
VGLDLLPETQLARRRRAARGRSTPQIDLSEARAEATVANNAILAWEKAGTALGAELGAYFPDSKLPAAWRGYTTAVRNYQRILSSICGSQRVELIAAVRLYLENTAFSRTELGRLRAFANRVASATPSNHPKPAEYEAMYSKPELAGLNVLTLARYGGRLKVDAAARNAKWKALIVEEGPDCQAEPFRFRVSYAYLGDQLLRHEDTVLRQVAERDLAGFHTGPGGVLERLTFTD